MGTLDGLVPIVGPLTAAQLSDEINTELQELFRIGFLKLTGVTGTNAYIGTVPLSRSLQDGNGFLLEVPNTNTAACTVNGVPLQTSNGTALQAGNIVAGQIIAFTYHQTANSFRLINNVAGGAAPIVRLYTAASSTWTKPSGLRYIEVEVQAAGSNGSSVGGNGGGGAGAYAFRVMSEASLAASVAVSIGAVNAASTATFGSHISCENGKAYTSGATAVATGGDINIPGQCGSPNYSTTPVVYGSGASSRFGSGGAGGSLSFKNATGYGAGGGSDGAGGGNGSGGLVIVKEYY